jgi:hypothetical protein
LLLLADRLAYYGLDTKERLLHLVMEVFIDSGLSKLKWRNINLDYQPLSTNKPKKRITKCYI